MTPFLTICILGFTGKNPSRKTILNQGLKTHDAEIISCEMPKKDFFSYIHLIFKFIKLKKKIDLIFIHFPGYQVAILARCFTWKPIILDAFTSVYLSGVEDRKNARKYSFRGLYYYLLDYLSCKACNLILLDTHAQIDYFSSQFMIPKHKLKCIYLSTLPHIFYPIKKKNHIIPHTLVQFHGSYIPLHGIDVILRSAFLLKDENIFFVLIGRGQTFPEMLKLYSDLKLSNTFLLPRKIKIEAIHACLLQSDISLGIFGNSLKSEIVIPNKVYEALATQKPIISSDTQAMRELFVDRKHMLFCKKGDPQDLAEKILLLHKNADLRKYISDQGYQFFQKKLIPQKVLMPLQKYITDHSK